jgi:hypothetical protein
MGQLIQIKRSSSAAASAQSLFGGELAYSTVEENNDNLYSEPGKANHSEIWIGKADNPTAGTGEKIYSSDLMHAWDHDKFIMKGDADGSSLTLGVTNVTSLISAGAVSGTTGTFSGAVSGTTGSFSGAVSGTSLTVGTIGNGGAIAPLTLTSGNNKFKLANLEFNGSTAATENQVLQSDANGVFTPVALDVDAQAKAAITGSTGITVTAGVVATDDNHITGLAETKIETSFFQNPVSNSDSSMVYSDSAKRWEFTPGRGISIGGNSDAGLTLSNGVLELDTSNLVANSATSLSGSNVLDGLTPNFGGLALQAGTTQTPALFTIGANTTVNFGSNTIDNIATPTVDSQAANKAYVDSVATGLGIKKPVKVSTTANLVGTFTAVSSGSDTITGTGVLTVDGIAVNQVVVVGGGGIITTEADRVLIQNQSNSFENGIYELTAWSSSAWTLTRAPNADNKDELSAGTFVFVEDGLTLKNNGYVISSTFETSDALGTLGADIEWSTFSSAGVIEGDGSSTEKIGNAIGVKINSTEGALETSNGLKVRVDGNGIDVSNNNLIVKLDPASPFSTSSTGLDMENDSSLSVSSGVLGVNAHANTLSKDGASLSVKLKSNSGLSSDTDGILVNAGDAIEVNASGQIQVKVKSGVNAVVVDSTGISVTLRGAGSGLELSGVNTNDLGVSTGGIIESMIGAAAVELTTKVKGILHADNGGLGVAPLGGLVFGNGSGYSAIANGTAGQIMTMVETTANSGVYVPGFATMDGGSF